MTHNQQTAGHAEMNPTSKMSFAVALCAFAAAGIGLLINHWMSGLMAAGGMAGVGLFYLAIGLLNLGTSSPIFTEEGDLSETAAHRLSGVANVDERSNETVGTRNEQLAKASN